MKRMIFLVFLTIFNLAFAGERYVTVPDAKGFMTFTLPQEWIFRDASFDIWFDIPLENGTEFMKFGIHTDRKWSFENINTSEQLFKDKMDIWKRIGSPHVVTSKKEWINGISMMLGRIHHLDNDTWEISYYVVNNGRKYIFSIWCKDNLEYMDVMEDYLRHIMHSLKFN